MIFAIETPDRICPQTVTAPYNGRWRAVEEEQQQNNEECIPYSNPRTSSTQNNCTCNQNGLIYEDETDSDFLLSEELIKLQ